MLDAAADPQTQLGELRARHLPVWTPEFDAAFPPAVCGSAWELDAIAVPVSGVDASHYGDPPTMAALGVMRYEHQLSRALAAPLPVGQLCVAVAAVGPARADALALLGSGLEGTPAAGAETTLVDKVTVIAFGPSAALAVACGPDRVSASADVLGHTDGNPGRLRAYLLAVASGLEDRVADISYRVARVEEHDSEGCSGDETWEARWDAQVAAWLSEGQIWTRVERTFTTTGICENPPPQGPRECPAEWPT
ncbi:hypothetical protein [Candidatus Poriferisodalis sp.]|uniref:hypothetical protein n=1 Tax=Candidatus Poriferisodalis sp. TaxID=3101277 RepID=UPI003AF4CE62